MSNDTREKAPGLIDEPPILVYPTLARILGINAAVVLQQLHYLINVTKKGKNTHNLIDGQWWVYNTYKEWHSDHFPWIAERTIQGIFLELEKKSIIKSRQSVKNKSDRRKWYTIDYKAWRKIHTTMMQNLHDDSAKSAPSTIVQNLHDGYTESTETSTDTLSPQNGASTFSRYEKPLAPGNRSDKQHAHDMRMLAVANGSFGLSVVPDDKTACGRITPIAGWLSKQENTTYQQIMSFYAWYDQENDKAARPRDVGKFAEHWMKWRTVKNHRAAPIVMNDDIEFISPAERIGLT